MTLDGNRDDSTTITKNQKIKKMTSKCRRILVQMFIFAIVTFEDAAESRAFKVGIIKGTKGKHWKRGVGGTVYVVNEKLLKVKNFFFDGGHPGCVGHRISLHVIFCRDQSSFQLI